MRIVLVALLATAVTASQDQPGPGKDAQDARGGNACASHERFDDPLGRPNWNGWGNGLSHQRFQSAKMAGLKASDVPKLKLKWAFGFPNATRAYSQPTLVGGRIFLGSAGGNVYSLNANSGCPDFDFGSSAILVKLPNGHRALVAGQKSGMVHAIDPDKQGELIWQTRVGRGSRVGGVQRGSAADAKNVYVAVSDVQMRPAAPGTAGAQPSAFGPPMLLDSKAGGGLFALALASGRQV